MECYGPNTSARISTWDGQILSLRNNYRKISFNFGPTLLSWMEANRPDIYEEIIHADQQSVIEKGGHGNAIAQSYNHTILPLATKREKQIQVFWGIEDFSERFGRDPEGMWLPECAVDLDTLEVLASNGISYTVLAPRQAKSIRIPRTSSAEGTGTDRAWISVDGSRIDPTRPYLCKLPSGKTITLFFYDGPISQAIAFEGLLNDGTAFANRLMQGYNDARPWAQLLSIATDGESYGHHHKHGEMALAYAIHVIEREGWARVVNFGEYLAQFPAEAEVKIHDNSSWSCVHGVGRWKEDCGCNSGGNPEWHQKWRAPLREAFRLLTDKADAVYDEQGPKYFKNPEKALRNYIHVLLDGKLEQFRLFISKEGKSEAVQESHLEILRLMEMMRNAQLIYTSCAWFFDEVSGIETVQNLKYAGRLIQLLLPFDDEIEGKFIEKLESCPSNIKEFQDATYCYLNWVHPDIVDLHRVIAHYVISNVDREDEGFCQLYCYELHERDSYSSSFGNTKMKLCRVSATSLIDGEHIDTTAVALHFGGHDFRCSITRQLGYQEYNQLKEELFTTYHKRSMTHLVRAVDEFFGRKYYSLTHMFREGKRELLQRITNESFAKFDDTITTIYNENRKFMDYLLEAGAPLPRSFVAAAEFVLKQRLVSLFSEFEELESLDDILQTAREVRQYNLKMKDPEVTHLLSKTFSTAFHRLGLSPNIENCDTAEALLRVYRYLDLTPDHWEAQNIVYALIHRSPLPAHLVRKSPTIDVREESTLPALRKLAEKLSVNQEPFEETSSILESRTSGSHERVPVGDIYGEGEA